MTSLAGRIVRLEARMIAPPPDSAAIRQDAAWVMEKLQRMANAFSPADAGLDGACLLRMSAAKHLAWVGRFAPERADLGAIMAAHFPHGDAR